MASTRVSTLNGSAPPTAGQLVRLACVDNDNHGASSTVIWLEFDARMLDDESSKSIDVTQGDERNGGALRKELFAGEVAGAGGDGCGGEGDREGRIRIVMGVRDSSGSPPLHPKQVEMKREGLPINANKIHSSLAQLNISHKFAV